MKPLLIMFCCLAIVVCEEEVSEGCDPWPSNVRSTRECCLIPHHSNDLIQDMCAMQCFSHGSQENECPTNCYINKTKILKEGTIDKTVVKRFYHNNNVYFDHDWKKFIDLGVDKCEFASSDSVTQSLLSFFNCVSDFLANNCISFLQVPECLATEDLFDKCRKDPANCSKWPNTLMHPASCCNTPQLENEGIKLECRVACERKELFVAERNKCIDKCVDASIQSEGKIDFELVKKVLIESSKKVEAWEKPIASAVEACEKDMKGLEPSQQVHRLTAFNFQLSYCLNNHLTERCVELRPDAWCSQIKRFMSRCPDVKPPSLRNYGYANTYVNHM